MEPEIIERLQAKSPEEAIIEQISRDFNLAPFMARTQFGQMRKYFEQYFDLSREMGQITFGSIPKSVAIIPLKNVKVGKQSP